jgi:threonyl-tRNA synthetase
LFSIFQVEDEQYQLKPMNCPFHIEVYRGNYYSYKDLPIRWAELGTVYRYERSGTMHGLFRVRGFTQDDAHIFCLPSQIAQVPLPYPAHMFRHHARSLPRARLHAGRRTHLLPT